MPSSSKKGTSGVHLPRQYNHQQQEEKIRQAGKEGEKQVSYALKWLDKKEIELAINNVGGAIPMGDLA